MLSCVNGVSPVATSGDVTLDSTFETFRIKNGPAQIVLGAEDRVLTQTAFTSSLGEEGLAPQVLPAIGYQFVIRLKDRDLNPYDFHIESTELGGSGALDMTLRSNDRPLTAVLHYRQGEGDFYVRKWIELRPDPGSSIFVEEIVLWAFIARDDPQSFSGPGQPVYVGDSFFGVEYPSAENEVMADRVKCSYLVGLEVGEEGYVSRKAVYGAAAHGRVREAFLSYIGQARARPASPFLLYNTWYDLRDYTDRDVIRAIEGFEKGLYEPYGIGLDSVILDDGWDDYKDLWRPHPERFPNGLAPVADAAIRLGARPGIWMSPLGGYGGGFRQRILGSLGEGMEKGFKGFCIAGEKHQAYFADMMAGYIEDSKVNYFKLDNLTRSCSNPFHGHRVGRYEQVGLTDAFIEVMERARAKDPDIMLNVTVGSWPSPWWLLYCDAVWRGGKDLGFQGSGNPRQQSITYVDKVLYERLRDEGAQFPVSSFMTHGVIKGRYDADRIAGQGENIRDFADHCWCYFGRGVAMGELYVSPDLTSKEEWAVLAEAIKFWRARADTLRHSEMVLGDPREGEVYGFFSGAGDDSVLMARNPSEHEAEMPEEAKSSYLPPGPAEAATHARKPVTCRAVYSSHGRDVMDDLGPFETRVVHCARGGGR